MDTFVLKYNCIALLYTFDTEKGTEQSVIKTVAETVRLLGPKCIRKARGTFILELSKGLEP